MKKTIRSYAAVWDLSRLVWRDKTDNQIVMMMLLFFAAFTWLCFFSQKIPLNNGIGWDGVEYVKAVKVFPHYLHAFDQYRAHRIFPSSVVAIGLQLFQLENTDQNIIRGFEMLNYISVLFSMLLWWRFVIKFNINFGWRLISFSGLFLNYPILSLLGFNPVLTDTVAFSCGVAVFYFYIIKKPSWVFLFSLIGCFTYPTFSLYSFFLLLFPYQDQVNSYMPPLKEPLYSLIFDKLIYTFSLGLTIVAGLYVFFLILPTSFLWNHILHAVPDYTVPALNRLMLHHDARIGLPSLLYLSKLQSFSLLLLFISSFGMFLYLYLGLKPLNCSLISGAKAFKKNMSLSSVSFALSLLLLNYIILSLVSNNEVGALTSLSYLRGIFIEVLSLPLINLVDMFVYYGPFVCLIIMLWPRICERIIKFNLGCIFPIAFLVVLSLSSEARQYINFIGMIVFLVLLVAKDSHYKQLPNLFPYFFVALSILFSKCWLHISIPNNMTSTTELLSNIWQDYFMNFGPWMSPDSYCKQLIAIVFSVLFICFGLKKSVCQSDSKVALYVI